VGRYIELKYPLYFKRVVCYFAHATVPVFMYYKYKSIVYEDNQMTRIS